VESEEREQERRSHSRGEGFEGGDEPTELEDTEGHRRSHSRQEDDDSDAGGEEDVEGHRRSHS
jgi:hypothetical protein